MKSKFHKSAATAEKGNELRSVFCFLCTYTEVMLHQIECLPASRHVLLVTTKSRQVQAMLEHASKVQIYTCAHAKRMYTMTCAFFPFLLAKYIICMFAYGKDPRMLWFQ